MNGARSTFKRKGYLLTALAAAVLLAASPGTASAQVSIGFGAASGTVAEGADNNPATMGARSLQITLTASGLVADNPATDANERLDPLGMVRIAGGAELSFTDADNGAVDVTADLAARFERSSTVTLFVHQTTADGNWMDEKYSLKLSAGDDTNVVSVTRDVFMLTVDDADVAPVAKFKHVNAPNISLQEASTTTINVGIDAGTTTSASQGAMSAAPALMAMITPANAKIGDCLKADGTASGNFLDIEAEGNVTVNKGTFSLGTGGLGASTEGTANATATYPPLSVEACSDTTNFRDMQATLSFVASSLKSGTDGTITDGGSITITVDSNEATPTVSFSTTDINIDEGGTQSVYLVADTTLGSEVGKATIMVSGDARVSLTGSNVTAGADVDAYGNGSYTVAFGDSANTSVTFSAAGDESLGDGESKMATATISSANGANIGSDDTLNITVRGATSVPALPLLGQLLLALFLMAGGSRLYRRRRG